MTKIEKLKLYCTQRLETEKKNVEIMERCAKDCETESCRRSHAHSLHILRVRIVEIEGFLLLLEMDDPVWGEFA
jgi:hypothetical protein